MVALRRDRTVTRSAGGRGRGGGTQGLLFTVPYLVLLLLFGIFPALYAVLILFAEFNQGTPDFFAAGLENFRVAFRDFRIGEVSMNLLKYLMVSVPFGLVSVTLLALLLHMRKSRGAATLRTLFFVPGALAGVPAVLLTIFMFDPNLSPFAPILRALGNESVVNTLAEPNLPTVFTLLSFFAGAGAWIAIFYGGLNSIPNELLEAAVADGASAWQLAWHLKRPLIKPYIVYMLVIVVATNVQLFAEPEVLKAAAVAPINPTWSPNQLAFNFAFQIGLFGVAAVISLVMLAVGLVAAAVVLRFTNIFQS